MNLATSDVLALLGAAAGALIGASGAWAVMRFRVNKNASDVNGVGRRVWKNIACELRCIAEEVTEPVVKAKLMHMADLIEPK